MLPPRDRLFAPTGSPRLTGLDQIRHQHLFLLFFVGQNNFRHETLEGLGASRGLKTYYYFFILFFNFPTFVLKIGLIWAQAGTDDIEGSLLSELKTKLNNFKSRIRIYFFFEKVKHSQSLNDTFSFKLSKTQCLQNNKLVKILSLLFLQLTLADRFIFLFKFMNPLRRISISQSWARRLASLKPRNLR